MDHHEVLRDGPLGHRAEGILLAARSVRLGVQQQPHKINLAVVTIQPESGGIRLLGIQLRIPEMINRSAAFVTIHHHPIQVILPVAHRLVEFTQLLSGVLVGRCGVPQCPAVRIHGIVVGIMEVLGHLLFAHGPINGDNPALRNHLADPRQGPADHHPAVEDPGEGHRAIGIDRRGITALCGVDNSVAIQVKLGL